MKRRIFALMLVVAMLAMTIVGCGSDKTNTTNTKVEESTDIESDGKFQISFTYNIPYEFKAHEDYITRDISLYLRDNDNNEIFSTTLYQDRAAYSVENQELVYYELQEYDISNTTLFDLRDTLLGERDILNDYYSIIDEQIEVWQHPDEPLYWRPISDDMKGMMSFELEDVTIHINVDDTDYYLNRRGYDGEFINEPVIEYAKLEDGSSEVAYAITYSLFGTYTCDGDLTQTQSYKDYVDNVQAEPINTVVLVGGDEEEELVENNASNLELKKVMDLSYQPKNGATFSSRVFELEENESEYYVETNVELSNGNKYAFSWIGDTEIGLDSNVSTDGKQIYLINKDYTILLSTWNSKYLTDETFEQYTQGDLLKRDMPSIDSTARVDECWEETITDDKIVYIYAIQTFDENNLEYKGYKKILLDKTKRKFAQFSYIQRADSFNQDQAYRTISSIELIEEDN